MRRYTLLILLVFSQYIVAQMQEPEKTLRVSGQVLEKDSNLPLEYATIAIIDSNNKIVTGGITDTKGKYDLAVAPGVYTFRFEFISYKTFQITNQPIYKDTVLPIVFLEIDAENLDEVIIRAETTEVQIRLDKKIYNIGKDLTTSGATISDALNNVPSVNVDVEGAISLRGNENVRILINGKPSAIAGFGSTEALQSLPAETIDRVEVITSPSARYDAEGTAGILNIILKKEKTLGINGSLNTNISWPLSSSATGNINLRTKKFNIFNTSGIRYSDAPGNAYFENLYLSDTNDNPLVIEDRVYDRIRYGYNINMGIEYFLSNTSSITASGFLHKGDHETTTTNNSREFNRSNELAFKRLRTEGENADHTTYQFSLNYVNDFSKDGHKLTADLQFENDIEEEKSLVEEINILPVNERLSSENITSDEDKKEYLAQIDYVLPIGENAQFEAGYRADLEESITDYDLFEEVGTTGVFERNDSISNVFKYNKDIHSFYTQYGNKFGKFSFLLGLRLENTTLKGKVDAVIVDASDDFDLNFDNSYTGLFPTVNLIYEIRDRENVTLGYNRRINRPNHWYINPFPSRSSEANIFQGNPGLEPAFSNAFDLGYLKRWENLTLTTSIYYQHETDAFERIQEDTGLLTPNGIPIIRTIPINLSTNQRYGFEAGVLYNPIKWLRFNGSFNFYKFITEGIYNAIDYGTENTSWFARGSVKVSLPSKIDWQTNVMFMGPRNNAQTSSKAITSINVAFSKDIMNDNGTIGFNVSDLLNSRKRKSETQTETFSSYSEFQWRERRFTLSFMYRFNQKKKNQRMNGGGNGGDYEYEGGAGS